MNFDHCINNKNWKFHRKLIRQKKRKKKCISKKMKNLVKNISI